MKREQITERLNTIFRSVFEDDTIFVTPELTADKVDNWTSITHAEMIAGVEEHFSIKLSLSEIIQMETAGDLISIIENKISGN